MTFSVPSYQPLVFAFAESAAMEIRANFFHLKPNWRVYSAGLNYWSGLNSSLSATSLCSGHTRGATDTMTMAFRGLIFNAFFSTNKVTLGYFLKVNFYGPIEWQY